MYLLCVVLCGAIHCERQPNALYNGDQHTYNLVYPICVVVCCFAKKSVMHVFNPLWCIGSPFIMNAVP